MKSPRPHISIAVGLSAIRSDPRGFSRLGDLHRQLTELTDCDISIDLSQLEWLAGHMAAPMQMIVRKATARGNSIHFIKPRADVETVLRKNGFLPGRIHDFHGTTMPVSHFARNEGKRCSWYAKRHLDRKEMPRMTSALQRKFFEGIDELFENSSLHSGSSEFGVTVGGQFSPRRNRLDFTMIDGGRGIPGAVRLVNRGTAVRNLSDPLLIDWAMQDYNTTRQGDIPGGLGSKILREFISLNGGKLTIASNGGFWSQEPNGVRLIRLSHRFPGTAVLLEVNTADPYKYDLQSAPDPTNIW